MNKGPSGGDLVLCARGAAPAGARRGSRRAGSLSAVRLQEHRVSGEFWAGVCRRGAGSLWEPPGPGGPAQDAGGPPHQSSALRGGRAPPAFGAQPLTLAMRPRAGPWLQKLFLTPDLCLRLTPAPQAALLGAFSPRAWAPRGRGRGSLGSLGPPAPRSRGPGRAGVRGAEAGGVSVGAGGQPGAGCGGQCPRRALSPGQLCGHGCVPEGREDRRGHLWGGV